MNDFLAGAAVCVVLSYKTALFYGIILDAKVSGIATLICRAWRIVPFFSSYCNRPFPSSPGPLFQNEGRCSAFDTEVIFHSHNSFSQERLCT